ncbi:hypothetical protein CANTEDRAFT_125301 [Yamadazyma tenuis ATCC 10573]|uniref:Uncharacterized protein n=1 Tax=Candida tenuis (strain ATCC 10573 / BCRC 21748 / CBS 615 / JCM 9827 / NBRC 10315 / NRRL Y-1498 / VKM Y-70) TaxID=590646 RepID=G3B9P2_CANTC|nr:uncharacterized protein CANTEDRAFT_125301 [Yamadazyma tenuis ATCC 10573]EGV61937.1 hypothetical protein CANTEDRAFT_125301 [Yamadazyma tenuis ATCC 10573]
MVFSCTPSNLIGHIHQEVAFSGNNGISTNDLWNICSKKLKSSELDLFSKQIIWKWLFFNKDVKGALFIWEMDKQIDPDEDYESFMSKRVNGQNLRIYPSTETQWKFLTGKDYSKKLKTQLGEYPFQLLCEIAKHGPSGIYASDLNKITGQDPRSVSVRLRKLEELKFIFKVNAYNKSSSQHTSLCIHSSFVDDKTDSNSLDFSDDINHSRDAEKLRNIIIQKVKQAPNGLRSLSDLKHELNLGTSRSMAKFFRGIVMSLYKKGYLEKVMVKSAASFELSHIYCIRFLKDIPNHSDHLDISDMIENDYENDDEGPVSLPRLNHVFPISTQFYHNISLPEFPPSSMDLCNSLTGVSEYKPFVKILDSITTFVKENDEDKRLQTFKEPYEGISISRSYDFEGKFKFYRYFCDSKEKIKDNSLSSKKRPTTNIISLDWKSLPSVGKIKSDSLIGKKRRVDENRKVTKKRKKHEESPQTPSISIRQDAKQEKNISNIVSVSSKPPHFYQPEVRKSSSTPISTSSNLSSIKSIKRREALIELIKESGGVVFTSAQLLRSLDRKLDNSTSTDMKTLVRDIAILVHTGIVESRDVRTVRSGQNITRKVLILKDENFKPMKEKIEEVQKLCEADDGKRFYPTLTDRKFIEADVTLYSTQVHKRRQRLTDLSSSRMRTTKIDEAKSQTRVKLERSNTMSDEVNPNNVGETQVTKITNPLKTYVGARFKGRTKPIKKGPESETESSTISSRRRPLVFTESDESKLFKLVVISRTFFKSIDFEYLAELFLNFTGKELKQKWTSVRKKIGGVIIVLKAIEKFEAIIRKFVNDGTVGLEDLKEPINFEFFLQLWEKVDNLRFGDFSKSLYFKSNENYKNYEALETKDLHPIPYEQMVSNSMRQKEVIVASHVFYQEGNWKVQKEGEKEKDKVTDQIKTILRALCMTDESSFKSRAVLNILEPYGDDKVQYVLTSMIRDKEIVYSGIEDTDKSFVLTDKFENSLVPLKSVPQMLRAASRFSDNIETAAQDSKGIILSQGIKGGHMISLLRSVSFYESSLVHINKPHRFVGYESRLVDKTKLGCDIIVKCENKLQSQATKQVPVPTGRACSHVWLDLDGKINTDLWIKIVASVLWYMVFRPGVLSFDISNKFESVLTSSDVKEVLNWLKESECINEGGNNDYWVQNNWYSIIG